MRKKLTSLAVLLLAFVLSSTVWAQATHVIDFEPGGIGADWTWTVSDNADNPALEFVANPSMTDPNTSATVAKFTARQGGNNWALCFTNDDGEFTFDATNSSIKIMVYKPTVSNVAFKVEGGTGTATEIKVANTVINAWEELTFDFSALQGQKFGRLVIIPDFVEPYVTGQDRGAENIIYFDNIQAPDGVVVGPLPEPAEAAPLSTPAETDVISIYSDIYPDIAGTNFYPGWGQSTVVSEVIIEGDSTLLYSGLNYQGIELGAVQDVSEMVYLHVDFWSPNSTAFEVFLISQSSGEKNFVFPMVNDLWVSVDIPLTAFTDQGLTITDIFQLKFVGNGTVYLDNLYFSKVASIVVPEPEAAAPAPTVDAANVISLFSDAYTDVTVDTWSAVWDAADVADVEIAGEMAKLYTNMTFAGIEFTSQTVDASAMTHFHMDIWTPDATAAPAVFKIKLVDFGADGAWSGGDDVEHELVFDANSGLASESWVSFDIPLADFTNLTTREHMAQLVISSDPNTVYVDNVYFYNAETAIDETYGSRPLVYALEQNHPNPFNPATKISFSLPEANHVTLKVYNMLGQEMATLIDEFVNAGTFNVAFDAAELPTGAYIYTISAGSYNSVKKMLLVK